MHCITLHPNTHTMSHTHTRMHTRTQYTLFVYTLFLQVNKLYKNGRYSEAKRASKQARALNATGFVAGVILGILIVVIKILLNVYTNIDEEWNRDSSIRLKGNTCVYYALSSYLHTCTIYITILYNTKHNILQLPYYYYI